MLRAYFLVIPGNLNRSLAALLQNWISNESFRSSGNLFIYTNDGDAARVLGDDLWSFDPAGFLPHGCYGVCAQKQLTEVPIHIVWEELTLNKYNKLLINVANKLPDNFAHFRFYVEFIAAASQSSQDIELARERYRYLQKNGYQVITEQWDKFSLNQLA